MTHYDAGSTASFNRSDLLLEWCDEATRATERELARTKQAIAEAETVEWALRLATDIVSNRTTHRVAIRESVARTLRLYHEGEGIDALRVARQEAKEMTDRILMGSYENLSTCGVTRGAGERATDAARAVLRDLRALVAHMESINE